MSLWPISGRDLQKALTSGVQGSMFCASETFSHAMRILPNSAFWNESGHTIIGWELSTLIDWPEKVKTRLKSPSFQPISALMLDFLANIFSRSQGVVGSSHPLFCPSG